MVALKRAEDGSGLVLRVLERSGRKTSAALTIAGQKVKLGTVASRELATWRLRRKAGRWTATRCGITELA
jgi:alpha-mannosidase